MNPSMVDFRCVMYDLNAHPRNQQANRSSQAQYIRWWLAGIVESAADTTAD